MVLRAPSATAGNVERTATDGFGARGGDDRHARIFRRFRASDMETRATLTAVCDSLRRRGMGEDDLSSAELILAEVLNNVVEHAYAYGEGWIEMEINLRRDAMACIVRDQGHAMPGNTPPAPGPMRLEPPDNLPEGGFGWHIIRCLTSGLNFRRDGEHNELRFVMPLSDGD